MQLQIVTNMDDENLVVARLPQMHIHLVILLMIYQLVLICIAAHMMPPHLWQRHYQDHKVIIAATSFASHLSSAGNGHAGSAAYNDLVQLQCTTKLKVYADVKTQLSTVPMVKKALTQAYV